MTYLFPPGRTYQTPVALRLVRPWAPGNWDSVTRISLRIRVQFSVVGQGDAQATIADASCGLHSARLDHSNFAWWKSIYWCVTGVGPLYAWRRPTASWRRCHRQCEVERRTINRVSSFDCPLFRSCNDERLPLLCFVTCGCDRSRQWLRNCSSARRAKRNPNAQSLRLVFSDSRSLGTKSLLFPHVCSVQWVQRVLCFPVRARAARPQLSYEVTRNLTGDGYRCGSMRRSPA